MERSRYIFACVLIGCTGCLPWMGTLYPFVGSFGTTSRGLLSGAETLPRKGAHFQLYHASKRAYAVPQLTRALSRCADKVAVKHEDAVLLIGDMSSAVGGFLPGHASHRSGRDVDIAFFTTDLTDKAINEVPLVHFDRFGVGLRSREVRRFDTPRNWEFLEALLLDPEVEIQWIFISAGLKALLLEWALQNNRDLDIIEKAASVLRQPGDSTPHDDHFHVRIYCPKDAPVGRCIDVKPFWSWVSPAEPPPLPSDDLLLHAALEGLQ